MLRSRYFPDRPKPRWLAATVLLALAGSTACRRSDAPEPAAETIRLFDHLGVFTEGTERPASIRPSRLLEPLYRGRLGRVAVAAGETEVDDRLSLVAPVGETHRFELSVPPGFALRLGATVITDREAAAAPVPGAVTIRIVAPHRAETALFETTIDAAAWSEVEVPLPPAAERSLELELRSESSAGGTERSWVAWSSPRLVPVGVHGKSWGLILISLDTLRADRLGCYGYDRPTSPFLDALAERSWRFDQAVSHSPWTRPAHRALFTGSYPLSHDGGRRPYLAETLWRAGYATEAWAGGGQMDPLFGFGRGFESYRVHDWIRDEPGWSDALRGEPGARFLMLHTYEIHDPYTHDRFARDLPGGRLAGYFDQATHNGLGGELSAAERAYVGALYDGGIAYTDEKLGRLFATLGEHWDLERTVVAITSDHGEELWEHGSWRHGQSVYDHQLRVPLILHVPDAVRRQLGIDRDRGVVESPVGLIDVAPTLLELLGLSAERSGQGRSLVPLLRGGAWEEQPLLAEDLGTSHRESKSLRLGRRKLIRTQPFVEGLDAAGGALPEATIELYDLVDDPGEQTDLAPGEPADLAALLRRLAAMTSDSWGRGDGPGVGSTERGAVVEGSPEEARLRARLEALGYLD